MRFRWYGGRGTAPPLDHGAPVPERAAAAGGAERDPTFGGVIPAIRVLRLVASTPLPCDMPRETVKRNDLAGHAGYGYCASHSRYFWGFRRCIICQAGHTELDILVVDANLKPGRPGSPRS